MGRRDTSAEPPPADAQENLNLQEGEAPSEGAVDDRGAGYRGVSCRPSLGASFGRLRAVFWNTASFFCSIPSTACRWQAERSMTATLCGNRDIRMFQETVRKAADMLTSGPARSSAQATSTLRRATGGVVMGIRRTVAAAESARLVEISRGHCVAVELRAGGDSLAISRQRRANRRGARKGQIARRRQGRDREPREEHGRGLRRGPSSRWCRTCRREPMGGPKRGRVQE